MTIYFIDEEIGEGSAYPIKLRMEGYSVKPIPDATSGYNRMVSATDIDLIFVDVMLASGLDPAEQFSRQHTQDGLSTGLVLVEALRHVLPPNVFSRVVLFSGAISAALVTQIEEYGLRHDIQFWRKGEFLTPRDFSIRVADRLLELGIVLPPGRETP